jgi:hypothetical protein
MIGNTLPGAFSRAFVALKLRPMATKKSSVSK